MTDEIVAPDLTDAFSRIDFFEKQLRSIGRSCQLVDGVPGSEGLDLPSDPRDDRDVRFRQPCRNVRDCSFRNSRAARCCNFEEQDARSNLLAFSDQLQRLLVEMMRVERVVDYVEEVRTR